MPSTTNLAITKLEVAQAQKETTINEAFDDFDAAFGIWGTYTPTWTNLTVGNGTVTARYIKINKTVFVRIVLVFGSTTSISGSVTFSLPVTSVTHAGSVGTALGPCRFYDASVPAAREGLVFSATTTTGLLGVNDASGTYVTGSILSSTVPFTWTTSDEIIMQFFYEAA